MALFLGGHHLYMSIFLCVCLWMSVCMHFSVPLPLCVSLSPPVDWDTGTRGHQDTGTLEHWDTATLEHWDTGNLGQWDTGTPGHPDTGIMGTWTLGHGDNMLGASSSAYLPQPCWDCCTKGTFHNNLSEKIKHILIIDSNQDEHGFNIFCIAISVFACFT